MLYLSPTENHPNSTVQVTGGNFSPYAAVDIYFDSTDEALAIANGAGKFVKIPIPAPADALPGTHYITGVQRNDGEGAQAIFTVSTDWAQFHLNEKHRGLNAWENVLAPNNVSSLDVDWTFFTGNSVQSSPAVVDGTLYLGAGDGLFAVNASTGAEIWGQPYGDVESSPAVANGMVYFGVGEYLIAANATTGALVCSYETAGTVFSPAVANGVVYVPSEDANLYALNANNCGLIWSFNTGGGIDSSPAVANGKVFIGSWSGNFYELEAATGAQYFTLNDQGNRIESSPAVSNGRVYFGDDGGNFWLVEANGAAQSVPLSNDFIYSGPAVANGVVYVGLGNGTVVALNGQNLSTLWTFTSGTGNPFNTSPAVANGVVYIGDEYGVMYALSAADGSLLWTSATGNAIYSSPAVSNGMVFVGSNDDNVYAYALNGGNDAVYKKHRCPPKIASLHPDLRLKPQYGTP